MSPNHIGGFMARFSIATDDPGTVKLFSSRVALDTRKKTYVSKLTGEEGSSMPFVTKTDMEDGPGDEVTTTLIAKLRGKPAEGQEKLAGRVQKLSRATHKMRIDKHRVAVNVGDIMDQKRVTYSLPTQVRARLSDWLAEICDEQALMTASGARGDGEEYQHYPIGYGGFPNPLRAPDANHYMVYDGSRTVASLTAGDTLSTLVLDKLKLRTTKQLGGVDQGKPIKMEPVNVGGGKYFLYMAAPESMFDLRRDEGPSGWLTLEKARMAAVGNDTPIVKTAKILHNNVLVDEMETVVKFSTGYGAGATLPSVRNLFFGANAVAIAWGSKSRKEDGNRFEFMDADEDYGEEDVMVVRMVAGWDKCTYLGQDFGVIANDLSFTKST